MSNLKILGIFVLIIVIFLILDRFGFIPIQSGRRGTCKTDPENQPNPDYVDGFYKYGKCVPFGTKI